MCMGKNVSAITLPQNLIFRLTVDQISLCELYKLIPELLRSYRLELSSPEEDLESSGFWLYKPAPMHIRVYRK